LRGLARVGRAFVTPSSEHGDAQVLAPTRATSERAASSAARSCKELAGRPGPLLHLGPSVRHCLGKNGTDARIGRLGAIAAVGQLPLLQPFSRLAIAAALFGESVGAAMVAVTAGVVLCVAGAKRFA